MEKREGWRTGQGRGVQLATFFISASKAKRRREGGAWRKKQKAGVERQLANVSGGAVRTKSGNLEREMRNGSAAEKRIKAATPGRTVFTIGRNT